LPRGDDAVAALAVDDFQEGFGGRLGFGFNEDRLRDRSARRGPRFQAALRRVFDHAHVGKQRMIAQPLGRFQQDALLDASA